MLLQVVTGTVYIEICAEQTPYLTGPGIASWSCLSLVTTAGELTLSLGRDSATPHHRHGRAGPDDMGLGELVLPWPEGGSSSGLNESAQLPPRSISWALGRPTLASSPSLTC